MVLFAACVHALYILGVAVGLQCHCRHPPSGECGHGSVQLPAPPSALNQPASVLAKEGHGLLRGASLG